jgi:RNA polymerase sigma-70 factor (ECF subfamily)
MDNTLIQSIYEQNKNDVFAYLLSLTRSKPLSEDLTSEVFLSAIKSLPTFKGNSSIKTWLFSIARHKWYDHLRKTKREIVPVDLLELYLSDNTDLESLVISKELANRIYELLEQEPDKNKAVVLMRIEGYSYFEIAQKYSISESSARVLNFRTINRLRGILVKEGYVNG